MKTERQQIGDMGEAIAKAFLQRQGYTILETNWRYKRLEVDLICKSAANILVFVEVKTRATTTTVEAASRVDERKEQLLSKAAIAYMARINHEWEIRFDVIGVELLQDDSYEIVHFKDAFFPGKW